jgi:hypothetical protein
MPYSYALGLIGGSIAWAKENKPPEGWKLTDNLIKEIKLRQQYLKENSKMSWPDYLQSKEFKVVKKFEVKPSDDEAKTPRTTKDDSEVLEVKRSKMNEDILPAIDEAKLQKRAKDDSEKEENWLIDIYVDGEYAGKFNYFGKFQNNLLFNHIKENVWTKDIIDTLGDLENFNMEIDKMGG